MLIQGWQRRSTWKRMNTTSFAQFAALPLVNWFLDEPRDSRSWILKCFIQVQKEKEKVFVETSH